MSEPAREIRVATSSVSSQTARTDRGVAIVREGLVEPRNDLDGGCPTGVFEDDRELVAADSPEHVCRAQRARPAAADCFQEPGG